MGTIDMALCNSGNLASFTDSYTAFDLPFLFRDSAHAHAVLDGEIGQAALASLDVVGIKGLANWENGFFCTWNNKRPIEKPEDMAGLKIRANNNPIHISAYGALGVSAITMGWSEVYTAIQNGTVDGVSVSIPSMYTDEYIQALKDDGFTVTDVDKEAFKEACWDAVYDQYAAQIGEDTIQSILNDY